MPVKNSDSKDSEDYPFPRRNPRKRQAESHQLNFSANWICREVVVVVSIRPGEEDRFPWASKRWLKSTGGERLTRLVQLKHSNRNCTLEDSEIFLTGMFLNKEKSNAISP